MERAELIKLLEEADSYSRIGLHEEALAGYDTALPLFEQHGLPTDVATCQMNRAICLRYLGRYEEALAGYDAVLPLFQQHGLPTSVARCQMNRAICLQYLGRYEEAVAGYDAALPLFEQHGLRTSVARCQMNRAACLRDLGRYEEALAGYEAALPLFEQHGLPADVARCQMNRAACLHRLGRYEEALVGYDAALPLFEQQGLPADIASCQLNRAACLQDLGRYEEALVGYDAALPLFEQHGLPTDVDVATCQMNRATCLRDLGRYEEALAGYEAALPLFEQHGLPADVARCQMNRANCLQDLGRYEDAVADYDTALPLFEQDGLPVDVALCQMNRAICLQDLGRYEEALAGYDAALPLFEQHGLPFDVTRCQMNRANCLLDLGRYEEALAGYDAALPLFQQHGLPTSVARCQMNRATCLQDLGRYEEALAGYEAAHLRLEKLGPHADDLRMRLYAVRAGLDGQTGALADARQHIDIACDLADSLAANLQDTTHRLTFREKWGHVFQRGLRIALAQDDVPGAFAFAQRAKGRIITDLLRQDGVESEMDQQERTLTHMFEAGSIDQADYDSRLEVIRADRVAALEALKGVDPQKPLSLAEITAVLHPGDALLDIVQQSDGVLSCFLLLPDDDAVAHYHEIAIAEVESLLTRWEEERTRYVTQYAARYARHLANRLSWHDVLANLQNLTSHLTPVAETILADLGDHILGPALPFLREHGVTSLILSPDGPLHRVPFSALRITGDDTAAYLIDEIDLQLIPTASSLAILRSNARITWPPTVLGAAPFSEPVTDTADVPDEPIADDPADLDGPRRAIRSRDDATFEKLTATGPEIRAIARLLKAVAPDASHRLHFNPAANREAVEADLPGARIVHLSTHGSRPMAGDTSLGYAIHFQNDTVITIDEVYQKQVSLVDVLMICLPACDLGEVVQQGGEAMGFNQAFLQAGAANVMAPIWAVEDHATALLMQTWYTHLTSTARPSLRKAWAMTTREMREHQIYRHPYFWAAFIPNGDAALRLLPAAY